MIIFISILSIYLNTLTGDAKVKFSEFLIIITTYCFFETPEILKCNICLYSCTLISYVDLTSINNKLVCFHVFDEDNTGFFTLEDLNLLMNMIHNIRKPNLISGNAKASWGKLTFASENLTYNDFYRIHQSFPRLFEPAFRLQMMLMKGYMGESWWNSKKNKNQAIKNIKKTRNRKNRRKKNV
jgi:hypothetical protein